MKKMCLVSLTLAATVFITLISLPSPAAAQTNILQNYSFEDNTGWGGEAVLWETGGNTSVRGTVEANSCQGDWAFNIGNDFGPEDAGAYTLQVLLDPDDPGNLYPVTHGDRVIFTMWMTGETNYTGNALLKIEFFDYDRQGGYKGAPIQTVTSTIHTGEFGYLQEIVTGIIPDGTISIAVVCSSEAMVVGSGYSAVNFDDGAVTVIEEKNLLINSGFEDNTGWGGDAAYWAKDGDAASNGTIEANAYQGSWAFNIGNDGGPANAIGYCSQVLRDTDNPENPYSVTQGEIITFTMWITGEANYTGSAFLGVEFYNSANDLLQVSASTSHTGGFDYLQEIVTGVAPDGAVKAVLVCVSEDMQPGSGYSAVNFDVGQVVVQPVMLPREEISLNGIWNVQPSEDGTQPQYFASTAPVPGFVDLADPSIENWKDYDYFWYRKTFTLSPLQEHLQAFINIRQSRYGTTVWLNTEELGSYISCYTSQKYDASNAIKYDGENVLMVKVGQKRTLPPESAVGYDYEETTEETDPDNAIYPLGIWGDVSLILTHNPTIERVLITPDINAHTAEAKITIKNSGTIAQEITISSKAYEKSTNNPVSAEITTDYIISAFEEKTCSLNIPIENMKLWSPDNPFLYKLITKVKLGGTAEADTLTSTFGMREFTIAGSDFLLNNKRIVLKGGNICFHRFMSDPERTDLVWDGDWIKNILIDIPKEHNFNFFRVHLGHAYNKWYDIADEYGIMLEDEWAFRSSTRYPFRWGPGPACGSITQLRREFTQWLYDNYNHPSIIIWDPQNEPHDGGDITRDIIREIIIPEMKEIDPTRPWEWGININIDFEPGAWNPIESTFAEDHPYIYSNGPVLNKRRFGYARSIDDMANSDKPTLLNEFLWFWLHDDGSLSDFTGAIDRRWLGRYGTNQQRLDFQSFLALELGELWRRLDLDGIAPFNYFGRSESGTGNWLTGDMADPGVLAVMTALKNVYAPFGVSIELWDRHFTPSEERDINVCIFNDTDQFKNGVLNCKITSEDETQVFFEYILDVTVLPFERPVKNIPWTMPADTGTYYLKAELIENSEVVAVSKKIAHVVELIIPDNLFSAKIMVYDPDNEILNYLKTDAGLPNVSSYDSSQLYEQDILILGEGVFLDANYNSRTEEITAFVEEGHSLIVIEPSYSVMGSSLLLNYGFEENDGWGSDADYWTMGGDVATAGTINTNNCEGKWAYNIGNDGGPDGAGGYIFQVLRDASSPQNLYPINPGDKVIFNMWVKGEESYTGNAFLKVEFYDYDFQDGYVNPPLAVFTSDSHTGEFKYLRQTAAGVAPEGTVSVVVYCLSENMQTGAGCSAVNFDRGSIETNTLLSGLSIIMDEREDINSGGYDSYCFVEELNLAIAGVAASSIENGETDRSPDKAIDGNFLTRWSSQFTDPQWIYVDLGSPTKFNAVRLSWESAYGKQYDIEISDDAQSWTPVYTETDGDGGVDDIRIEPVVARYVRMYGTQRATAWGYSLYEFEVKSPSSLLWNNIDGEHLKMFNGGWGGEMISQCDVSLQTNRKNILARSGMNLSYSNVVETIWGRGIVVVSRIQIRGRLTEDADPGADLYSRKEDVIAQQYLLNLVAAYLDTAGNYQRLGDMMPFLHVEKATATSVEKDIEGKITGYIPDKAIDNDYSTRWSSSNSNPQWICLDFGKSATFNKVILHWESAYATSYQIQVSNDKQDWTNVVYSTTAGNGGIDEIEFSPVSAQYIRMFGEERIFTDYGYSLYEFGVYSVSATAQISGVVTIQVRKNNSETISFELRNPGETEPVKTFEFETDSLGNYTLTGISSGTYDFTAKSSNTLRAKEENITVIEGETISNMDLYLLDGDANDDNKVDYQDRNILDQAYGSMEGDLNWDERADFNGDNKVSYKDRNILEKNYGQIGEQ